MQAVHFPGCHRRNDMYYYLATSLLFLAAEFLSKDYAFYCSKLIYKIYSYKGGQRGQHLFLREEIPSTWGQGLCNRNKNWIWGTDLTPIVTEDFSKVAVIYGFSFELVMYRNLYQAYLEVCNCAILLFFVLFCSSALAWKALSFRFHGIFSFGGNHSLWKLFLQGQCHPYTLRLNWIITVRNVGLRASSNGWSTADLGWFRIQDSAVSASTFQVQLPKQVWLRQRFKCKKQSFYI